MNIHQRPAAKHLILFFFSFLLISSSPLSQSKKSDQFSEKYMEATKAYKSKDLEKTIELMSEIVEAQDADSLEMSLALIRIGIIHSNYYDQFAKAIEFYDRAEKYAAPLADPFPMRNILMSRLWSYKYLREYEKSLENGELYIKKFTKDSNHYQLAAVYRAMVDVGYNAKMDLNQVNDWVQKMMYHSRLDTTGFNLPHSSATEARFYWEQGNLPKAAKLLKAQLNLSEDLDLSTLKSADVVTLKQLAMISLQSGDEDKAVAYLEALKLKFENENETEGFNYYELCLNLEDVYCTIGDFESAWKLIPQIQRLTNSLNLGESRELILKMEKGRALTGLRKYDEAEKVLQDALIDAHRIDPGPRVVYSTLDFLANLMREKEAFESSIGYYNDALLIAKTEIDNNIEHLADSYFQLAKTFLEKEEYITASSFLDSAFYVNQSDINKVEDKFSNVHYPLRQLAMYELKLELLESWYYATNEKRYLTQGIEVSNESNSFVEHQLRYTVSNKSKIDLARSIYEKSFLIATLSYNERLRDGFEHALFYSDKLKSFFLKEQQFLKESIEQLDINQSLVSKRDSLQDLLFLNKDKPEILLSVYEELDATSKKIGDVMSYSGISLSEIKALIADRSYLTYQIIDNRLYRLYQNDTGNIVDYVSFDEEVDKSVLKLREEIATQMDLEKNIDLLSNTLIPKSLNEEKNLTVIPDGVLSYLPFEILTYKDKWLFENFIISYEYGLKNLLPNNKRRPSNTLLAVAPAFGPSKLASADVVRSTIVPLPGAQKEVQTVSAIFGGALLSNEAATEKSFRDNAGDHMILHLATHAIVDDNNADNSRLIFSLSRDSTDDGYLSAKEIAKLDLRAHLVTLSACNTAFGKIKKGEGVMSLSRAFAYAGVPATVVSLWPASDKSTPKLMKYFYQNLKDGQSKDVALNNARKSYLATATGKARHPFYWGGFVLIGDNSPIEDDTNLLVYVIPSVLVIVMILTLYRRKSRLSA